MKRPSPFLFAVLLLASCTRGNGSLVPAVAVDSVPAVSVAFTKAGGGAGDVRAFAYRRGGLLEASTSGRADTASMSLASGVQLDFLVASGLPDTLSEPAATLGAMLSREVSLSSQVDGLTAVAVERGVSLSTDTVLAYRLSRVVSRVSLDTVVCVRPGGLSLVRAYLSNVCGTCSLSGVAADGGVWHCRMGNCSGRQQEARQLLVRDLSETLSDGVPFAAGLSFLLFPNPSSSNAAWPTDTAWCPRPSRLVLECVDGERKVWYPVTLPSVPSNVDLHISRLVLSGDGTSHPDWPVDCVAVDFTVEVLPWDSVSSSVRM